MLVNGDEIANEKAKEEYNLQFDRMDIEKARQKFKEKEYKKSLEIYGTVEHKSLFNDYDKKIIEYCEKHI